MNERALLITIIVVLAIATSILGFFNMRSDVKEESYLEQGYQDDD